MIHEARIQPLNRLPPVPGQYVLYWMQQSQRAEYNHALEYAIAQANALRLPVLAAFALTAFPEANRRHYQFMLEGLRDTRQRLAARGIARQFDGRELTVFDPWRNKVRVTLA